MFCRCWFYGLKQYMNEKYYDVIIEGTIFDNHQTEYHYIFAHNNEYSIQLNHECDSSWHNFKFSYLNKFVDADGNISMRIIEELCFHDVHWNWTSKYYINNNDKNKAK